MSRRLVAIRVPNEEFGVQLRRIWEHGDAVLPLPWSSTAEPQASRRANELLLWLEPDEIVDACGTLAMDRTTHARTADQAARRSGLADDCALVVATSGSTGAPKGVMLTHAALTASTRASVEYLGALHGQRFALALPLHHVAGIQVILRSWLCGTEPEYLPASDPEAIADSQANHISLVPTQAERILDQHRGRLRWDSVLLGGGPADPSTLEALRAAGPRVVISYGMTETCGGCVYDGVPIGNTSVRIESDGRIAIAGPVLFAGYLGRQPSSAQPPIDGWFVTSDLGTIDGQGRLQVFGRADDIIVSGGENIPAQPVEQAVRSYPGVADAAVIGVADPHWGHAVVAFVVPNHDLDLDALDAHIRSAVPRGHAPKRLVVVETIPKTGLGKADRHALSVLATQPG